MLHIVSPLSWVARHHGLRPAAEVVVAQDTIIGSLVCCYDDRVQHAKKILQVRTWRTDAISPDNLVGTDGLFH